MQQPANTIQSQEHSDLEEWAKLFGGTAILGFISTLLIGGKFVHHVFQRRGLIFGIFIVPPALLSGLLGLMWFAIMELFDPWITADLRSGLEAIKGNLINFVFAALILGLTCARGNSQHNSSFRGMATSIFHEGMPMIIYSQILLWGQSTCCLIAFCLLNFIISRANIPSMFPAMIPLGIEAGGDIIISTTYSSFWSETVMEEAESLGLLAISIAGIILFSGKSYFISKGWLGQGYLRDFANGSGAIHQGTGQAEAFERVTLANHKKVNRSFSADDLSRRDFDQGTSPIDSDDAEYVPIKSETHKTSSGKVAHASLGSHLSLIALTVFMSFGASLICHLLEIKFNIDHHFLSGIRMFKLSMCCALISMQMLLQRTTIRFNRDWFMRLCGLMLDLLVISALAKAHPKPNTLETTHYLLCSVFVIICLFWNAFCFFFVAKYLFPNYWYERALTLSGDAMGHSYTGLLFARTLDPSMESPVPAAYAYKLMLFFIPSSGAKNTIVVSLMLSHGPWAALSVCLCVVATWIIIFDTHFKHRFLPTGVGIDSVSVGLSRLGGSHVSDDGDQFSAEPLLSDAAIPGGTATAVSLGGGKFALSDDDDDYHLSVSTPTTYPANTTNAVVSRKGSLSTLQSTTLDAFDSASGAAVGSNSNNLSVGGGMAALAGKYVPRLLASEPSSIISAEQMNKIALWLSDSKASKAWTLTYSLRQHGASLFTLIYNTMNSPRGGRPGRKPSIKNTSSCVIVIEDSWGYIFGGVISPCMQNKKTYYGSGESFVFTVAPTAMCYKWSGQNNLFVLSNEKCFAMGGGGDGFAFQLDDELDTGVSNRSATFNNETLSSSEFFKCLNVEVWVLDTASDGLV